MFFDDLKVRHGSKYTDMQYRMWAEMMASGSHPKLKTDEPPKNSMFQRAGGGTPPCKKKLTVTQLMTEAAAAFITALSPARTIAPASTGKSPVRSLRVDPSQL